MKQPASARAQRNRMGPIDHHQLALVPTYWRLHNGAMPNMQIKDVSPETHAVFRRRASEAHQSLQEYMLAHLDEVAKAPTLNEVLDRIGGRTGGAIAVQDAVEAIRDDRDRR